MYHCSLILIIGLYMRASVSVYVFYTSLNMIDIHVGHLTFIITIIIIIIIITIIGAILGSD